MYINKYYTDRYALYVVAVKVWLIVFIQYVKVCVWLMPYLQFQKSRFTWELKQSILLVYIDLLQKMEHCTSHKVLILLLYLIFFIVIIEGSMQI